MGNKLFEGARIRHLIYSATVAAHVAYSELMLDHES